MAEKGLGIRDLGLEKTAAEPIPTSDLRPPTLPSNPQSPIPNPFRRVFTPVEIAQRYGVGRAKVVGWIRSGQLRAVNLAAAVGTGRRDRWRISQEDLAAFEALRQSGPAAAPKSTEPRRSKAPGRREHTEFIE